jgi:hypothetical protein
VIVDDEAIEFRTLLVLDHGLHHAEVIADMKFPGGLDA